MPLPPYLGLLRRRECLLPTGRGWLAFFVAFALVAVAAVHGIYGFLAVQDSVPGGALVVEGWAPDYALAVALEESRHEHYEGFYVSGGPLDEGAPLIAHRTYAELGAAILAGLGANPGTVQAVPAPKVKQDRTFTSAVALRDWLQAHGQSTARVNVMSLGAHSRRTRLLYEKAFGPATRVGIIAVADEAFDPHHWWSSSSGFRSVTDETIAYLYARLLFRFEALQR